jgi:LTXXQ motif family protein
MLLSRTGELGLTDAQVVRLAAIARRSEGRRRSMRAAMDSAEIRFRQPGDSVARRQFGERMRAEMQRTNEQMQMDQRDALAVLTPDQQSKAWNLRSAGPGRGMGAGVRGMRRGERGMRGPRMGQGPRVRGERVRPPRPMQFERRMPFERPMRRPVETNE